jgi:hypothetical protein
MCTPPPPQKNQLSDTEGGSHECRGIFIGSFLETVLAMVVYSMRRKQKSNMFVQYETKQKNRKKCLKKDSLKQCLTLIFNALDNAKENKTK